MIARLSGKVVAKTANSVVLDVNGVGYKVLVGNIVLDSNQEELVLLTHLNVKEDSLELFGFLTETEKDLFESLIGVSGVGPKTAMSILSKSGADGVTKAIHESKPEQLYGGGVGKKTAERIILELSGKLSKITENEELISALIALGYNQREAVTASKNVAAGELETQLREALKNLGAHK